jgi:hypothetical protein|nr:MAG TPA: Protein of unknown function (DUF1642) [Caudoviricetes sp.]
MNKQELIEYCESLKGDLNKFINGVEVDKIIKGIEQLDEPQKPVVPQFVADWIKYCKFTNVNLQNALFVGDVYFYNYANQKDFSKLKEFLETENNQATFVRAWLDGYEVEKENRYFVKMKGVNEECEYLVFGELSNTWKLRSLGSFGELRKYHTRKELEEAGFGEVFNSPLFEVEEVEE